VASEASVRAPIERPVGVLLAVFGLCGFAVAQPLLDVLGRGATFFAAHQAGRYDVLLFTVLVTVVPAVAVSGVLLAAYAAARSSWRIVVPLTYGFLTAAILVPHIDHAARFPPWVFFLVALTVGTGASFLYWRYAVALAFARATAFAPIFFAALFLLSSPASTLVVPQSAAGPARANGETNAVLLVLDELPLGALLDRSGGIDEHRFPGFSRLAKQSTWYRNATTVAPWTYLAVPAILTGSMPHLDKPPVESNYPRNLFRMLAESHVLHSHEGITFLCPAGKCHQGGDRGSGAIYRDAATVFLHGFLPDGLAERWLPPVAGRWADFASSEAAARDVDPLDMGSWISEAGTATVANQVARFQNFLASIGSLPGGHAGLWVGHFLLPHFPVRYLPDGRAYDTYDRGSLPPGLAEDGLEWSDDRRLVDLVRQRFLLQIKYVDTLVEQLLDRLSAEGIAEDTLLVVTADHGLSFAPGSNRRGLPLTEKSAPEILPVPLFVKYPRERGGHIDDQRRQIIDIMPTLASAMDVDLPDDWQFDGRSLRGEPGDQRRWLLPDSGISPPPEVDLEAASSGYLDQFGEGRAVHDIFASEPFSVFVGTPTKDLEVVEVPDPPIARLLTTGFADFDPEKRSVPVLARFSFGDRGPPESEWLAVALNGTIAGIGPIYQERLSTRGIVMLDPALLRPGPNTVEPFLVTGEGRLVRTK